MLALTHVPSPLLDDGQRTHVERIPIDFELALEQHASYCQMLRDCEVRVITLNVNRDLPDSVFIEDTAIVLDEIAVLALPGAAVRRLEVAGIEPELEKHRPLRRIEPPATLDGGDVLAVGRQLLVGRSSRTNNAGIAALSKIVRPLGYDVQAVLVRDCLHLKTACTALPDGSLLVQPKWLNLQDLRNYEVIPVPESEPWAADVLLVGTRVCVPVAHPLTENLIRRRGFEVRTADLSEFAKAEGGITCLSLLLNE